MKKIFISENAKSQIRGLSDIPWDTRVFFLQTPNIPGFEVEVELTDEEFQMSIKEGIFDASKIPSMDELIKRMNWE